jgi:hypothetical protein
MEKELLLRFRKSSAFSSHIPIAIALRLSRFALHSARIRCIRCFDSAFERLPSHGRFHVILPVARSDHSRPLDRGQSSIRTSATFGCPILHRDRYRLYYPRIARNGVFVEGSVIRKTHNWLADSGSSLRSMMECS